MGLRITRIDELDELTRKAAELIERSAKKSKPQAADIPLLTGEALVRMLAEPLSTLRLSSRVYGHLWWTARIHTIGVLVRFTEDEVLSLRGLGKKSLHEIKQALAGLGLQLGMIVRDVQPPAPTTAAPTPPPAMEDINDTFQRMLEEHQRAAEEARRNGSYAAPRVPPFPPVRPHRYVMFPPTIAPEPNWEEYVRRQNERNSERWRMNDPGLPNDNTYYTSNTNEVTFRTVQAPTTFSLIDDGKIR